MVRATFDIQKFPHRSNPPRQSNKIQHRDLFAISACRVRANMTGKRALAQDGLPGSKSGPHFEGMKRRKLLHNGAQSLSPKRIPSNVGGKQKASIIFEEACGLPNKSSESWELERKAPQLAEELAQNAQERNALSTKWSITQCSSGRFLNVDPVFTSDGR